jgi:hypothetical protein
MVIVKVMFNLKEQKSEQEQKKALAQLVEVYRKVPGLKRKYFLANPVTGESGGLYVFESQEAVDKYFKSDVWNNIILPMALQKPKVEQFIAIASTDDGVLI